jgi:branched-chain amino acid transport system substrate-binding protein
VHPLRGTASLPVVGLVLALAAGSCTDAREPGPPVPRPTSASVSPSVSPSSSTPATPVSLTVAFIETLDGEETPGRVTPAFQGARLAFSNAEVVAGLPIDVEVAAYNTEGDPARAAEIAAEIAASPEVVAAIGAPGLTDQAEIGDALDSAEVPWITLSGAGSGLGDRGWTGWRRLVADQVVQGIALAQLVDSLRQSRQGVCVLGDGTSAARSLLGAAVQALHAEVVLRAIVPEAQPDLAAAANAVAAAGCGVALWGGGDAVGAALRRQLVQVGLRRMPFIGNDRIRDPGFLEAVGPAGEGVLAACPCVDVSTSTELAAQRFIQDYQSEFGLPPGPYAVEAWDAARMLVAAFREGAVTRGSVRAAVAATASFDGLAGTYVFAPGGDLADPAASVRISRVEGGRWLELATTS